MKIKMTLILPALAGLLTGCQGFAVADEVPARIVNLTDESHHALHAAVKAAVKKDVYIAHDALTTTSVLVIELSPPRQLDSPIGQDRILAEPLRFTLVKKGDVCLLIDGRDGSRYPLESTECVPE